MQSFSFFFFFFSFLNLFCRVFVLFCFFDFPGQMIFQKITIFTDLKFLPYNYVTCGKILPIN